MVRAGTTSLNLYELNEGMTGDKVDFLGTGRTLGINDGYWCTFGRGRTPRWTIILLFFSSSLVFKPVQAFLFYNLLGGIFFARCVVAAIRRPALHFILFLVFNMPFETWLRVPRVVGVGHSLVGEIEAFGSFLLLLATFVLLLALLFIITTGY